MRACSYLVSLQIVLCDRALDWRRSPRSSSFKNPMRRRRGNPVSSEALLRCKHAVRCAVAPCSAMPAMPLTDEHWSGLPLLMCNMDPGVYRLDVHTPVLITRDDLGTEVEVFNDGPRRIHFRQAPLRFDLFSAGLVMDAVSDRPATKSLVVALPGEWMPPDDGAPDGQIRLRARFQFADVELRRLVWRLTTHHRGGEPLGHSYNGAVSRMLVDRIVRLQLARDARDPDSVGLRPEARRLVEAL